MTTQHDAACLGLRGAAEHAWQQLHGRGAQEAKNRALSGWPGQAPALVVVVLLAVAVLLVLVVGGVGCVAGGRYTTGLGVHCLQVLAFAVAARVQRERTRALTHWGVRNLLLGYC